MSLALFLRSVPAVVRRHEGIYQTARELEPVLAPYATALDLVETLTPEGAESLAARRALVVWLLHRQYTSQHALWQALLAHAFRPMLRSFRRRLRGAEDADSRVLLAFFEVVANTRAPESAVFLAVRRGMVRALFPRRQPGELETVPLDEDVAACMPRVHADPSPFTACLAHEVADRLVEATGDPHVVGALVGFETAAERAARLGAEGDGTRSRLAAMSRRQRRAVAALRADEERR